MCERVYPEWDTFFFFLRSGGTLAATPVAPQSDSESCSEPSAAVLLLVLGEDVVYEDNVVSPSEKYRHQCVSICFST